MTIAEHIAAAAEAAARVALTDPDYIPLAEVLAKALETAERLDADE